MQRTRLQNLLTLHPWLRGVLLLGFGVVALDNFFDPRYGWLLSITTVSVALLCVVFWPLFLPLSTRWAVVLSPVLWLLCMFVVHLALPPSPSRSEIERSGALIIQQLEAYHTAHDTYPESLEAAGIPSPRYRCGSFEYRRWDSHAFCLRIGDYMLDGFTATWDSEDKSWYWDT